MALQDFKCRVFGLYGGSLPWSFSFTMQSTDSEGTIAARLDTATAALWNTSTSGIQNLTNADVTLEGTEVATLLANQHEASKTVTNRHIAGTNANPSLPWDNTVTVGFFSSTGVEKRQRGHISLPALAVDQISAHVYTSTCTGHLQTVLDVFFPAVRGGSSTYYTTNHGTLVDGTAPFEIHTLDKYKISNKPGVKRKRTNKVVPTYTVSSL